MEELEPHRPTAASLDVLEADEYLLHLLLPRFQSILGQVSSLSMPKSVPKAVLHAATIWALVANTPGTLASGLKVDNSSRRKVLGYIALTTVLPCLYELLKDWYFKVSSIQGEIPDDTAADTGSLEMRARDRRRRLAKKLIDVVTKCDPVVRFAILMSWWAGKASAPTPEMCLTQLAFVETRPPRDINVAYAHRRWIYEVLLRTLQAVSPIQTVQDARDLVGHIVHPVLAVGNRIFTRQKEDRCGVCNERPVVPYITDCDHVYCYTCLWIARAQHSTFKCRVCGLQIRSSRPGHHLDRRVQEESVS